MSEKYINNLKECINKEYDFNINEVKESSRGVDGETWIVSNEKEKYFVKIAYYSTHKKRYINSINTLNILNKHNIKNINSIIKTKDGKDYIEFNGGLLAIYTIVDGSIDYNYPYDKIIKLLVPIYKINDDLSLLKEEDFDIDTIINNVYKNIELCKNDKKTNTIISKYNDYIINNINELKKYYSKIDKKNKKYITHGDACVNVMVSDYDCCLIDWDDTCISPIERDCWFFADYKEKISYINKYLKKNKIEYTLSYDLLAFYAYKNSLEYLNEALSKYFETKNIELLDEVEEILNGWVKRKIESIKKNISC